MKQIIFLIILFCTSCSVGPRYKHPCAEIPSDWKNKRTEACFCLEANDYWWQVFEDEQLEELEQWAIENNRNLFIACERIQEARALMGAAAADFYPHMTLNPEYTNTGELIKIYATSASTSTKKLMKNAIQNVFRAHELFYYFPFNLSYEVDLWGKIRDQYASAKYNWLAQREDYEAVLLNLTTNLATAYFQLRIADTQIDLLKKTLQTRQKAYEINKSRYEEEITFYADVTLAAEEVETVIEQYEEMVRQRKVLEDLIAVLLGVPASEFCLEPMPLPLGSLPPCIPEGIPSEVIQRRPDIAEAEYNVRAQHALVKREYSLFFPSLTLTGVGGFSSPIFKDFMKWKSRYWMLGAEIDQLIFDGFKTVYNLKGQTARFLEASGTYQQQVLTAFQEVEDALASLESYAKQYEAAEKNSQLGQKTYQLYLDRYKSGLIYYINVVNTERDLLNYQMTWNTLMGFRYIATIQLIKALGGGW